MARDGGRAWLTPVNRISLPWFTPLQMPMTTVGRGQQKAFRQMANSIWTIEEFTCAGCGMKYTATREEHSEAHTGSFKCSICSGVVHAWSGKHHFFGWQAAKTRPPVFGRRWADVEW